MIPGLIVPIWQNRSLLTLLLWKLAIDYFQQNVSSSFQVPRKESINFSPEACCETRQGIFNDNVK